MSFKSTTTRSSYVVAWDVPQLEDVQNVVKEVRALESCDYYVAYIPDGKKAPDPDARKAMMQSMGEILEVCRELHFIIEGQGFGPSIARSVIAGVTLATRQRGRVHVHASIEAVRNILPGDATARLEEFRTRFSEIAS